MACTQLKGMTMKRFAQTLLVISLATAGGAAFAATPTFPSSAQQEIPLSAEFPDMVTYQDLHRDTIASQPEIANPSSAQQEIPLSAEFPDMVTYKQEHRDTIASQPAMTWPAEVQNEVPMSAVFPNMTTYADLHRDLSNAPAYAGVTR
jgi:hypothetical protein